MEVLNKAKVSGVLLGDPVFSNDSHGESFYSAMLQTRRLSGKYDEIPIMISNRVDGFDRLKKEAPVLIEGQFRSFNHHMGSKTHLELSVFVTKVTILDQVPVPAENSVAMIGKITCPIKLRSTTFSRDMIADVFLSIPRKYDKSDYIPVICWQRIANYASTLPVGTWVKVDGRIQRRCYSRLGQRFTVYELSAFRFQEVKDEDKTTDK